MVDVALNPSDDNHEAPPPAEVGEEMRPARDALLHGEHPRALADEVTDGLAQVVAAPLPPATTLSSHAASAAPILAQAAPCLVATPSQLVALITFRRRRPQGPPPQAFSSSARGATDASHAGPFPRAALATSDLSSWSLRNSRENSIASIHAKGMIVLVSLV